MKFDAFINHLLDITAVVLGLMFVSFIFGFLLGQTFFIVQLEWIGYLGWGIITLMGIATIYFIATGLYWNYVETKTTINEILAALKVYRENKKEVK